MRNVEILRSPTLVLVSAVLAVPAVSQAGPIAAAWTDTADVYESSPFRRYAALGGETGNDGGFIIFHKNLFGREKKFSVRLIAKL